MLNSSKLLHTAPLIIDMAVWNGQNNPKKNNILSVENTFLPNVNQWNQGKLAGSWTCVDCFVSCVVFALHLLHLGPLIGIWLDTDINIWEF